MSVVDEIAMFARDEFDRLARRHADEIERERIAVIGPFIESIKNAGVSLGEIQSEVLLVKLQRAPARAWRIVLSGDAAEIRRWLDEPA